MPDPNLRQVVREVLRLPDETPLTQGTLHPLTGLNKSRQSSDNRSDGIRACHELDLDGARW